METLQCNSYNLSHMDTSNVDKKVFVGQKKIVKLYSRDVPDLLQNQSRADLRVETKATIQYQVVAMVSLVASVIYIMHFCHGDESLKRFLQ